MATKKIFVSYSHSDEKFVEPLVAALRKEGLVVWYDDHITGGENWEKRLKDEIKQADIMVMVLSKASSISENVTNEMHYAKQKSTRIIPIMIEHCEPQLGLISAHYINFIEDYDDGYKRLVHDINHLEKQTITDTKPVIELKPKKAQGLDRKENSRIDKRSGWIIAAFMVAFLGFATYRVIVPSEDAVWETVESSDNIRVILDFINHDENEAYRSEGVAKIKKLLKNEGRVVFIGKKSLYFTIDFSSKPSSYTNVYVDDILRPISRIPVYEIIDANQHHPDDPKIEVNKDQILMVLEIERQEEGITSLIVRY